MRGLGCLGVLLFLGLLTAEFYGLLLVIAWLENGTFAALQNGTFAALLIMAGMTIVGVKLAQFHARRLPQALLSGQGGGRLIALIGALLIVVPGFFTDVIGLILQIPLVQKMFSKVGMALAASLVKRAMGGGFGKGFPGAGFPGGGFPGGAFPGGPFPGMKPDERITNGKPGPKTYDVEPDKD